MKQFNIVNKEGNRVHEIVADFYQYLSNVDRSYVFYVSSDEQYQPPVEVARYIPSAGDVIHTTKTLD